MTPSETHAARIEAGRARTAPTPPGVATGAEDATAASRAPAAIGLTINGRPRQVPGGATVTEVLALLGLDPRTVVVEHNREIVRDRASLDARRLRAGDELEVVHFVGGG